MSTQSVTAQDPGGEWPSHRAPGPAPDYQNQYAALSAVSISVTEWKLVCVGVCVCVCVCVYLTFLRSEIQTLRSLEIPPPQPVWIYSTQRPSEATGR